MSTLRCPHCENEIELIGQRELTEEYGLGPNPVAHLRQQGEFPEPVLAFGNRNLWLRGEVTAYIEKRTREKAERLVEDFAETLKALPETERAEAIKLLLDGSGTPK